MSVNVTLNGVVYPIPTQGDLNWAPPLDRYLIALAAVTFQPSGGTFTLTADANFGPSFGLFSQYFTSRTALPATAGVIRLAKTDTIDWRNNANSGNNALGVDSSDNLTYNGVSITTGLNTLSDGKIWIGSAANLPVAQTLTGDVTVTNAGVTSITSGSIVNADINAAAAIAYSKLNLTGSILNTDIFSGAAIALSKLAALNASIVPITDGSGFLTSSTTTVTQLGFLDATSSIQTQLNTKQATGNYITALTGDVTATGPGSVAATLATVNGNVGSFTNANITVNAKGLITAASSGTAGTFTSINGTFIGLGRNRIINGDCIFDQVNEGSAYTAGVTAHYTLDQWRVEATGTPKFTVQQSSTVPTGTGATKSILFTTSVSGTPGASDGCNIEQPLAGPYIRDFMYGTASAVTLTLSFWVRASVTGTYSISFCNGATNRSYVSTYVVSVANTYEFKTVTFIGDTTGSWTTANNTFGMKVVWDAGSGSTVTTSTLNAWQAGSFWKATGSVSLVSTAAATLYITLAQLEIGSVATAFEYTPYHFGLRQCQQFLYKSLPQGTPWLSGQGAAGAVQYVAALPATTGGGGAYVAIPTQMNAIVDLSTFSTINGGGNTQWWNTTLGAPSGTPVITGLGDSGFFIKNPQVLADSGGDVISIQIKASSQLGGV